MANLDATVTETTKSNKDNITHYANVMVGTAIDEADNVILEQLGKFGVALSPDRDVDKAVIDLFEEDPSEVVELHVVLRVASAKKKAPVVKKLVKRS